MAVERLLKLYFMLASGDTMTAEEIAGRLGVSKPTVHRDIEVLRTSGLTVDGTPNVGYRVDTPPDLPPLFLSADEFRAMAAGAKIVAAGSDRGQARAAADLLAKVRRLIAPRSRAKFGL